MYSLDIILTGQNKFAYEIDDNFRNNPLVHGLRTPNEAFFHQNPKLLGLVRQFHILFSGWDHIESIFQEQTTFTSDIG